MSSGGIISVLKLAVCCGILWSTCFCYMDFIPLSQGDEDDLHTFSGPDSQEDFEINKRQSISPAELHAILKELSPEKIKELTQKGELRYVALLERPQSSFTPRLGRRKRFLDYDDDESFLSNLGTEDAEERLRLLLKPPFHRRGSNVKTIHLQSSFVPRLGKKRSDENAINVDNNSSGRQSAISGRSQHVVNLSAGSAFTPRLGRSGNRLSRHQRSPTGQAKAHATQ